MAGRKMRRIDRRVGAVWALVVTGLLRVAAADTGDIAVVRRALDAVCVRGAEPAGVARAVSARVAEARAIAPAGRAVGWRARFVVADGGELEVERLGREGGRRARLRYRAPADGRIRPAVLAVTRPGCIVQVARRIVYADGGPSRIELLDARLRPTGETLPLNPPVPPGDDPGGTAVALVDSGVNYRLQAITARLARDERGRILGYDFWDMDRRPFDVHPVSSPFFPQRHGTRTASLLLEEAPPARLVPYRYPRPAMARMADLVADAARDGVTVVALPMGSGERDDWAAFARAARAHPDMLFVVSAGNDGRDIDARPIYPAALPLENLLTVTSAAPDGTLARGSNWGSESVDLMVAAEEMLVTEFDGRKAFHSGSSYAAVRAAGLAACLLAAHPEWRAPELKRALLARAQPLVAEGRRVAHGLIGAPTAERRGACPALPSRAREVEHMILREDALYPDGLPDRRFTHVLRPSLMVLKGSGWEVPRVVDAMERAAAILARCGVRVPEAALHRIEVPERLNYFRVSTGVGLAAQIELTRPAAFFVRDTRRVQPHDAEAFGRSNSRNFPELRHTVWLMQAIPHPGIGLAHELVHVLIDNAAHSDAPGNLMRMRTAPQNVELTAAQCARIRRVGTEQGLLRPLEEQTR